MSQKSPSADFSFQGYVREVRMNWESVKRKNSYPFSLPALCGLDRLVLHPEVTFVISEFLVSYSQHTSFSDKIKAVTDYLYSLMDASFIAARAISLLP